jgi:cytochrome c553
MKRVLGRLVLLALGAALAGLLFAWSGLYNVAATAGHWPVTAWLLHFAMRNSVETHAMPVEAPPLADPALVERGAGHYETGCAPCHGAPGSPANRIPQNMLPEPPYLPAVVSEWSPEELFWIVKHGLKYTGMPAWPAQNRDDEVWAMTAFLLKSPDLSRRDYAALAYTDVVRPPAGATPPETPGELFTMSDAALIGGCARCHGIDGAGRPSGAFPRIDGQSEDYLARALHEYASGVRPSGIMQPVAAALDEDQMRRLARHYAARGGPAGGSPPAAGAELLELGRRIAAEGLPERQVPPCSACHGLEDGPLNPLFPSLTGQHSGYLALQLQLWKAGKRGGSAYAEIMAPIAENMREEDMRAVAAFYGSLSKPGLPQPRASDQ